MVSEQQVGYHLDGTARFVREHVDSSSEEGYKKLR
jgi:hypothetical protein